MPDNSLLIRPYQTADEEAVVNLWQACELTVPWNNPRKDIARKLKVQPELFLVGILANRLIASVMGGYDGHRGCINYLAVHPDFQGRGYARQLMDAVESGLRKLSGTSGTSGAGCSKINLQIRKGNDKVIAFYEKLGFTEDPVVSMGKRLEVDQ